MTITYEEIANRAFEIWESEGRPEGKERDHWFQAESELRQRNLQKENPKEVTSGDPNLFKPSQSTVPEPAGLKNKKRKPGFKQTAVA